MTQLQHQLSSKQEEMEALKTSHHEQIMVCTTYIVCTCIGKCNRVVITDVGVGGKSSAAVERKRSGSREKGIF